MLTLANIRQFRQYLKELTLLTDELLLTKERNSEFNNFESFQSAIGNSEHCPQEYFKFRYFEKYIELCKDKKGYYIYVEHFYPTSQDLQKLRYGQTAQFRFNGVNFEGAKELYLAFALDLIHQVSHTENKLFYLY